jgi:hypothetical protein
MKLQKISQNLSAQRHKSNHLTLEVKTFFGTLHQRRAIAWIPSLQPGLPTDDRQHHHQKKERENSTQQEYKKCKT